MAPAAHVTAVHPVMEQFACSIVVWYGEPNRKDTDARAVYLEGVVNFGAPSRRLQAVTPVSKAAACTHAPHTLRRNSAMQMLAPIT